MGGLTGELSVEWPVHSPLTGLDWRLRSGSLPASVAVYECVSGEKGETTRRAANLVWEIENRLHRQGWPAGSIIGSEVGLAKSFSVSREVMREAVRIGEVHGSLRMRRGRGGGLLACRPNLDTVSRAIAECMYCSGVTLSQLRHACELFEPEIVAQAAHAEIRDSVRSGTKPSDPVYRHLAFRRRVLERVQDPVLALLWNVSTWLGLTLADGEGARDPDVDQVLRRYEDELEEALAAGDPESATHICQAYRRQASFVDLLLAQAHQAPPDCAVNSLPGYTVNRSSHIARKLMQDVRELDYGERLGSEWDLCTNLNAGRPIVRQALRLLEDYGLLEVRRGRAGGIFTSKQKRGAILRLAYPHLAANNVQPDTLLPLLWKMNIANVRLAGERARSFSSGERDHQLHRVRDKVTNTPRSARWIGIQQAIGAIGQNQMLDIIQCMLVGYTTRAYQPSRIPRPMSDIFLHQAWEVAHAVIQGQKDWAQIVQDECQTAITGLWKWSASKWCSSPYVRPIVDSAVSVQELERQFGAPLPPSSPEGEEG